MANVKFKFLFIFCFFVYGVTSGQSQKSPPPHIQPGSGGGPLQPGGPEVGGIGAGVPDSRILTPKNA